jgi:hypothetical protein
MDKPFYEFQVFDDAFRFEFKSISSEKVIQKAIFFKKLI